MSDNSKKSYIPDAIVVGTLTTCMFVPGYISVDRAVNVNTIKKSDIDMKKNIEKGTEKSKANTYYPDLTKTIDKDLEKISSKYGKPLTLNFGKPIKSDELSL